MLGTAIRPISSLLIAPEHVLPIFGRQNADYAVLGDAIRRIRDFVAGNATEDDIENAKTSALSIIDRTLDNTPAKSVTVCVYTLLDIEARSPAAVARESGADRRCRQKGDTAEVAPMARMATSPSPARRPRRDRKGLADEETVRDLRVRLMLRHYCEEPLVSDVLLVILTQAVLNISCADQSEHIGAVKLYCRPRRDHFTETSLW